MTLVPTTPRQRESDMIEGPWWVNAIYKFRFDVPAIVIALGLVWLLATDVRKGLDDIRVVHALMATDIKAQAQTGSDLKTVLESIQKILQVSCVNAAKDAQERTACLAP